MASVEIKNYRSVFVDDAGSPMAIEFGRGLNTIVGPNNCGKSNVLRAIALVLDPEFPHLRSSDMPAGMMWAKPRITLTFETDGKGAEKTLLKRVREYEVAARGRDGQAYADDGIIKLRATISGTEDPGDRRLTFVAKGAGNRTLADDDPIKTKALQQFRTCCRFVMIQSGESLQSVLEGKFREILHNVVREHLSAEFDAAENLRSEYIDGLRRELLAPLADRISEETGELFPEVESVHLEPFVGELNESLARVGVFVTDAVETELAAKGTGVRGGVLVAMLRYMADHTRRSMIFAVEEPEAFLHPGAQERVRDDLEALAFRDDVTVLVTTHSPFVVSRDTDARTFAVDKAADGRTAVMATGHGADPHSPLLGGLFRDRTFTDLLDRVAQVPAGTVGIVVVEGSTDVDYARIAAHAAGRRELVEDLHFIAAGGANMTVVHAAITRHLHGKKVAVLLDSDGPGRAAFKALKDIGGKNKEWAAKGSGRNLFMYRDVFEETSAPLEAEHLWPPELIKSFVAEHDGMEEEVLKSKEYDKKLGWLLDLQGPVKDDFADFLRSRASGSDAARWIEMLELIRDALGLTTEAAAPDGEPTTVGSDAGGGEKDTDEPADTASSKSLWPLPGPRSEWPEALLRLLRRLEPGPVPVDEAVDWLVRTYDGVNSDKVAESYWVVPTSMGFCSRRDGVLTLTGLGECYLNSPGPGLLAQAMLNNVVGVNELQSLLGQDSWTPEELNTEVTTELNLSWKTHHQVQHRLRWMEHAGLALRADDGWTAP